MILCAIIMLFAFNTYGQEYHGKKKDIQKILKNIEAFSQYFMNGEPKKIAECYALDGKILPPNENLAEGRKELEEKWTMPPDMKVLNHKVTPVEIRIVKKYAYDYGYYEGVSQNAKGEKNSWKGKYVIVWKKVGKDWKIYLDIWNRIPADEK